MVRQIILAGFVVFFPAGLGAQGRGAMPSHAVNVAPRAVMPAPHRMTAQAVGGTRAAMGGGALRAETVVGGGRGKSPLFPPPRTICVQRSWILSHFRSPPGIRLPSLHPSTSGGP